MMAGILGRRTSAAVVVWSVLAAVGGAQTDWEKDAPGPVLELGEPGAWDSVEIGDPVVIFDEGVFKMWYWGSDGIADRIGYATSADGLDWMKHSMWVLGPGAPGSWNDDGVGERWVLRDGALLKMWYSGDDGAKTRIGYAWSTDGIAWTEHPDNPVLDVGAPGSLDAEDVTECCVIRDGAGFRMWYTANGGGPIMHASSPDGVEWTKTPSFVLRPGPGGSWDDDEVDNPSVLKDGGEYRMWYGGEGGPFGESAIGYATSPDGLLWTKSADNPVLGPGDFGEWDQDGIDVPTVLLDCVEYRMWYDGSSAAVGYARAAVDAPWGTFGTALSGENGEPTLTGSGELVGGETVTLTLTGAVPNRSSSYLVVGLTPLCVPFKAGTMVPDTDFISPPLTTDASGMNVSVFTWPAGIPPETDVFFQCWIIDPSGPKGFASTHALQATTP